MRVIGVPKTIDNDLTRPPSTFGFDTAVAFAPECIDRLFTTATSHGRVIVVEVMGRYAGWIALYAGVAAGAHGILIPEIPFDLEPVAETERRIASVSERSSPSWSSPKGRRRSAERRSSASVGQAERLGGIGPLHSRTPTHDGEGVAFRRSGAPATRRVADSPRSAPRSSVRRRRRARSRRGTDG